MIRSGSRGFEIELLLLNVTLRMQSLCMNGTRLSLNRPLEIETSQIGGKLSNKISVVKI